VAIVHDYLNQRGGAEKVVLEMSGLWPDAPIYTSLYRPNSTFPEFRDRVVRASPLDRLPVDRGFRNLFPLYPAAFAMLGAIDADVVISSSSGWAHMARVAPGAFHAVYCYTPARWIYGSPYLQHAGRRSLRESVIRRTSGALRSLDAHAARRADLYIAISNEVRTRIRAAYGRDAVVVYPPVNTDQLTPRPRGERLLVISRLLPYKRVDLVVRAAARLRMGLDVVGDGPMLADLRRMAGPGVAFHRAAPQAVVNDLLEACRAVCVAGGEDFGIVAVEAQAAGKPVIAYARGGALETVRDGLTGILFKEQTESCLVDAIRAADGLDTSPSAIAANAARFSRDAFRAALVAAIEEGCSP
jgi:glycosyltransferase involved in cell wall biosynthesis